MPRLFTAIELPDAIRSELRSLHSPIDGARWVEPADMHLTLRFFGDTGGHTARELIASLAEIEHDVFPLRVIGAGAFGGNDPHTVWAGIEPSPQLDALARAHEKAARNAGLAPETRTYKPHITLARLRQVRVDDVARFLSRASGYRSAPFYVARTVLMSSKPGTGGGPYAIEDSFPLRGSNYVGEDADANW